MGPPPHVDVPPSLVAVATHVPFMQPMFAPQAFPHLPQFRLSNSGFEQYCFCAVVSVQIS